MATNNAINLARGTFSVYLATTAAASGSTIVFDTKLIDETSSYDTSTGIFTVPVAGNWLFSYNVGFGGTIGTYMSVALHADAYTYSLSTFNPSTAVSAPYGTCTIASSIIIPLAVGQVVRLATGAVDGNVLGSGAGYAITFFSGCIIL